MSRIFAFVMVILCMVAMVSAHWPPLYIESLQTVSGKPIAKSDIGKPIEITMKMTRDDGALGATLWNNFIVFSNTDEKFIKSVSNCAYISNLNETWTPVSTSLTYDKIAKKAQFYYEFGKDAFVQGGFHTLKCTYVFGSASTGAFSVNIEQMNEDGTLAGHGYWVVRNRDDKGTKRLTDVNPLFSSLFEHKLYHTVGISASSVFDVDCKKIAEELKRVVTSAAHKYIKDNGVKIGNPTYNLLQGSCSNTTVIPESLITPSFVITQTTPSDEKKPVGKANAFVIFGLQYKDATSEQNEAIQTSLASYATSDVTINNADWTSYDKVYMASSAQIVPSECLDGVVSGNESDVDCGGAVKSSGNVPEQCIACAVNKKCTSGSDCQSGLCSADGRCTAPSSASIASLFGVAAIAAVVLLF